MKTQVTQSLVLIDLLLISAGRMQWNGRLYFMGLCWPTVGEWRLNFGLGIWFIYCGRTYRLFGGMCYLCLQFDVHVTVHHDKFHTIKPTRCTNFSNLLLEWNSTCYGQFLSPSSGVFHCIHSNGICHTGLETACEQEHLLLLTRCRQTCMPYTIAVCTVENSW